MVYNILAKVASKFLGIPNSLKVSRRRQVGQSRSIHLNRITIETPMIWSRMSMRSRKPYVKGQVGEDEQEAARPRSPRRTTSMAGFAEYRFVIQIGLRNKRRFKLSVLILCKNKHFLLKKLQIINVDLNANML